MSNRKQAFTVFVLNSSINFTRIINRVKNFQDCQFSRFHIWMMFLQIYQDNDTTQIKIFRLTEHRDEYKKLKESILTEKKQKSHPLQKIKKNQQQGFDKHKQQIEKDIIKTFPQNYHMKKKQNQQMLIRILLIYCKNSEYYKGFNQILGILFLAYKESMFQSEGNKLQNFLQDQNYIQHDIYTMFKVIMQKYIYYFRQSKAITYETQHFLLKKVDFQFFQLLQIEQIQLQQTFQKYFILKRWVKTLFINEFQLENIFRLFDWILYRYYENKQFEIIKYICLGMLIEGKYYILNEKSRHQKINLLKSFPKLSIQNVLEHARDIEILFKQIQKNQSQKQIKQNIHKTLTNEEDQNQHNIIMFKRGFTKSYLQNKLLTEENTNQQEDKQTKNYKNKFNKGLQIVKKLLENIEQPNIDRQIFKTDLQNLKQMLQKEIK